MSETKAYERTYDQCKATIKGVCPGCGGEIVPIETVDNSNNPTYWSGCTACNKYCFGVTEHVFKIARAMVIEKDFTPYQHMDLPVGRNNNEGYKAYYNSTQIEKTCGIVRDVLMYHNLITLTPA